MARQIKQSTGSKEFSIRPMQLTPKLMMKMDYVGADGVIYSTELITLNVKQAKKLITDLQAALDSELLGYLAG